MTESTAPVPAVLALWEAGYPGLTIQRWLGVSLNCIRRIVHNARSIHDHRAVIHRDQDGSINRAYDSVLARYPDVRVVTLQEPYRRGRSTKGMRKPRKKL